MTKGLPKEKFGCMDIYIYIDICMYIYIYILIYVYMYYIDIYIDMNKLYRSYFYPLKPPIKTLFHQKTTQVACFVVVVE